VATITAPQAIQADSFISRLPRLGLASHARFDRLAADAHG
jgi:hypothetical protein